MGRCSLPDSVCVGLQARVTSKGCFNGRQCRASRVLKGGAVQGVPVLGLLNFVQLQNCKACFGPMRACFLTFDALRHTFITQEGGDGVARLVCWDWWDWGGGVGGLCGGQRHCGPWVHSLATYIHVNCTVRAHGIIQPACRTVQKGTPYSGGGEGVKTTWETVQQEGHHMGAVNALSKGTVAGYGLV